MKGLPSSWDPFIKSFGGRFLELGKEEVLSRLLQEEVWCNMRKGSEEISSIQLDRDMAQVNLGEGKKGYGRGNGSWNGGRGGKGYGGRGRNEGRSFWEWKFRSEKHARCW